MTCKVDAVDPGNGVNGTVNLGPVNGADMQNENDVAGMTGFKIYIGEPGQATCTNGTKVWASFEPGSSVDPKSGALKITEGTATGVWIRLFDGNGTPIDVWNDDQNVPGYSEVIADNQATLGYAAAYQRNADPLVAGVANSYVMYNVRFEPNP